MERTRSCNLFQGNLKDYFKLYEATAHSVKRVDASLRIGGPSSSACKWIREFLSFCNQHDVPCDFVTTHHYSGDALGNSLTAKDAFKLIKNDVPLDATLSTLFFHPEVCKTWHKGVCCELE